MEGLNLEIAYPLFSAFLMASARVAGFALVAPPFSTRGTPARARVAFIVAMAIPLTAWTESTAPELTAAALVPTMVLHLMVGAIAGFLVLLAVTVLQIVGDAIDLVGGFSMSIALDPLMLTQASVMGRLHQILTIALLFISDLHLMVLQGLAKSLQLMPEPLPNWPSIGRTIVESASTMFMVGFQVAAPVVGVMLLADIALGLLTRAAPALNAFALGFPLKILLTLLLMGLVVVQYPSVLVRSVTQATNAIWSMTGG